MPLLTCLLVSALAADAASVAAQQDARRMDAVVVVASKVEQQASEVAGTVSVIERARIDELLVRDIADLVRYEPGVAVPEEASRFGLQGFSIRGLDGNRVGIEVDGVPVPDGFAVGSFSQAGRNMIDPEILQRVEILRGPASTLYGSDALAGVVSLRTRDPADVLGDDRTGFAGVRGGIAGRDDSVFLSGTAAARAGAWESLASVATRRGHESGNHPRDGGLRANPADVSQRFGIGKLVHRHDTLGTIGFTAEHSESERETEVDSLVGGPAQFATTTALLADDRSRHTRASLRLEREAEWLGPGHLELHVFAQRSGFDQRTDQTRRAATPAGAATRRLRRFDFDTRLAGAELLVEGVAETGALRHWQVAGIELARSSLAELRDGVEIDLATGTRTNVVLGEVLPVRDFPDSVTDEIGLYWQDEISRGDGRWTLIPGLRYDRYRVDARPDALWRADNPGVAVADIDEGRFTPRIGLRYALDADTSAFAQYTAGFRAPPFSDVNIGLNIAALGFAAIPNPGLEAETSHGFELGLRHYGERRSVTVAAFHNRYRNLIESRVNLGRDPDSGLLLFQSQNRRRARIHGLEATWNEDLGSWLELEGWSAIGALSWSRGEDTSRGEPLNSVLPARLVAGLRRDRAGGRHSTELVATVVEAKDDVDQSGAALYEPAGYATLDLYHRYRPSERLRIDVGLFNLADRRYWDWSRTRGVTRDAHDLDLYTGSGRSAAVTVSLGW